MFYLLFMFNTALRLFECESEGCAAVAVRGSYCVAHAIACTGCWSFFAAADLTDGECAHCRRQDCGDEMESIVGAVCWCGQHKGVK